MAQSKERNNMQFSGWLFYIFLLGFAVVFIGFLFVLLAAVFARGGSASAGVVIFIGPFPIVFGYGPNAGSLILVGIIIAVVSLLLFIFMRKRVEGAVS